MTFTISRRVASRLEQLKMLSSHSAQIRLAVAAAVDVAAVDVAVAAVAVAAQSICVH